MRGAPMNKPLRHDVSSELPDILKPWLSPTPPLPSSALLAFGTILPVLTIAVEFAFRLCANAFFDPMPTRWHVLGVGLVPAANLVVWLALSRSPPRTRKHTAFAAGVAIGVAGFYTFVFLPLTPLAFLALLVGVGIFALAPLAALIAAIRLRAHQLKADPVHRHGGAFWGGMLAGLALLVAVDIPAAATRLGIQWAMGPSTEQRSRGIALIRTIGDEDLLLRLCYDATGRLGGILSLLVDGGWGAPFGPRFGAPVAEVRDIFYRVTGTPFSARPMPLVGSKWDRFDDFQRDTDIGGSAVGGRVKGLTLVSSRIDGTVSSDSALAYLEWVFELRNSSAVQREARLQLALPPGAAVARATLWINGEEREAAYGGRAQVRRAYEQVVRVNRDPLLVTTKGADRVLAQAFPVPVGGTMKFKLGITAPLALEELSAGRLTLPAIVDRNFSFDEALRHAVWIESAKPLSISAPRLAGVSVAPNRFRLAGELTDRELTRIRPTITAARDPAVARTWSALDQDRAVLQEITRERRTTDALMIVIDGSGPLAGHVSRLIAALEAIPPDAPVGLMIAGEPELRLAPAPWSPARRKEFFRAIRRQAFVGGQDNMAALADALTTLEAHAAGEVLWIHGPQPVAFAGSKARLEQASARIVRLPRITLYNIEPGPNELLPDLPWAWAARSLPRTDAVDQDLRHYFARALGRSETIAVKRTEIAPPGGEPTGSAHVARLWASERVLSLMLADPAGNRAAATALAVEHRLITPVTGAVVLETRREYEANNLTPPESRVGTVPTVPEPHEWLLLIIAGAMVLVFWRRRAAIAA